jgi:hypothetical protein
VIACIVPVHDEELLLEACLDALWRASAHPQLAGESVAVVVVLDACSDRSRDIAIRARVNVLETHS